MNARKELQTLLSEYRQKGFDLVCASITYEESHGKDEVIQLTYKYTEEELSRFYNQLDFNYDSGYGTQQLYGTVWLTCGAWLERWEYDGSEGWEVKRCPAIPNDLYYQETPEE